MAYIYLDESGDLGFDFTKKKTSSYFVVTFLFVDNPRPVGKIIQKTFGSFTKKQVKAHGGTLHAYKESPKTRQRILTSLNHKDIAILSIYLNKRKVYTKLQDEKQVLYNYITNILLDRIMTRKLVPLDKRIELVASRRDTNKFLNDNFKSYLEDQVSRNHKLDIHVSIKTPHEEKCLQIVDMASWTLFRKREHGDESYYNLIKSKVIEESPLFP